MSSGAERRSRAISLEFLAQIAVGTTATVDLCRARDHELAGRLLAVKRVLPELVDDPSVTTRFLDEVWMTASLQHPHVVGVVGWGTDNQGDYLAVELVQGVSLARLMKTVFDTGEEFTERMVVYIGACLCRGLMAAHELHTPEGEHLHLVHRDLSPTNVLLGFNGDIKIADFGLAKAKQRLTTTTVGLPKRAVVSPEEVRGKTVDQRADLFALGVLLFELLAGRRPWAGTSEVDTLKKMVREAAPDLMEHRPKMDRKLAAVVAQCLQKDPAKRYQAAREVGAEFDGWLYAHGYQEGNPETLSRFVRRNAMKQMRWFERAVEGKPEPKPEPKTRSDAPSYDSAESRRGRKPEPDRGAATAVGFRASQVDESSLSQAAAAAAAMPASDRAGEASPPASDPGHSSPHPGVVEPTGPSSGSGAIDDTTRPPTERAPEDPDTDWDSPTVVGKRSDTAAAVQQAIHRRSAHREGGSRRSAGTPPAASPSEAATGVELTRRDTTVDMVAVREDMDRSALPKAPELMADPDSEDDYAPTLAIKKDQLPWLHKGGGETPPSSQSPPVASAAPAQSGPPPLPARRGRSGRPSAPPPPLAPRAPKPAGVIRPGGIPSAADGASTTTLEDLLTQSERLRARAARRKEDAVEARAAAKRATDAADAAERVAAMAEEAALMAIEAVRLAEQNELPKAVAVSERAAAIAAGTASGKGEPNR